jgi:CRP/FNR family cyclic AMP-dependent transcriptional regulator
MLEVEQTHRLLANFFSKGKKVHHQRKNVIIPYNAKTDCAYFIVEGYIKVLSHSSKENERIHYLYGPGDFFPVTCLFEDTSFQVEFVALTDVVTLRQPLPAIKEFIESCPSSLLAIAYQQTSTYGRIINLNMGNAEQRIAQRILALCEKFGKKNDNHFILEIPITQQELANMVRLTRERTGKVIAELEHKGCMHFGRRDIIVYPKKLREITEE